MLPKQKGHFESAHRNRDFLYPRKYFRRYVFHEHFLPLEGEYYRPHFVQIGHIGALYLHVTQVNHSINRASSDKR